MQSITEENLRAHRKRYFVVGCLCLLGLLILAAIFYRERVIFADTALQNVYLLIEQRPCINWIRPGAIIPQIIPLCAIWLHTGLRAVMILHSLSFILFFLAIYLIAYRLSKRQILFFLIPLYLVLITTQAFYWPQSELQQGMVWLCLYAVFLYEGATGDSDRWRVWTAHFLFILWIQFFHPLIFFPLLFLQAYHYSGRSGLFSKDGIRYLSICIIAFTIRYVVGLSNSYEAGKLSVVNVELNPLHLFSLNSVHVFAGRACHEYALYCVALSFALGWLMITGMYRKAILLLGFTLGYWLLIMISYPYDERFYTENMLLPLGFMVALAWVADILPAYRSSTMTGVIALAIAVRFAFIYHAHVDYTDRLDGYRSYFRYIESAKLNGVFVDERSADRERMITTWASGYESMLISSIDSPDSCMIVQIDDMSQPGNKAYYTDALNADTAFVARYRTWRQSRVPQRYFRLRHGKYEMLPAQQ